MKLRPNRLSFLFSNSIFLLICISIFFTSCRKDNSATENQPEPEMEEIFQVVEDMPRFPGCEDLGLPKDELKDCAQQKMLAFVYDHLTYPTEAIENDIEGTVVVRFIVEEDGSTREGQILKSIGYGTSEEVLRIINLMPDFIPGKQRDRPVKVYYNLPVEFNL